MESRGRRLANIALKIAEERFYNEPKNQLEEIDAVLGSDYSDEDPSWLPPAQKVLDDVVFQDEMGDISCGYTVLQNVTPDVQQYAMQPVKELNCLIEPTMLPDNEIFSSLSRKIQVLSNVLLPSNIEVRCPTSSNAQISDKPVVAEVNSLRRWKASNSNEWKRNVAKTRRSVCLPYITKNVLRDGKSPKPIHCDKCIYKCTENFAMELRQVICANYWKMDFKRKKDFILSNIQIFTLKRLVKKTQHKERSNAKHYFFENGNEKIRVCRNFFCKTLSISMDVVTHAVINKDCIGTFSGDDKRGRHTPINKTRPELIQQVKSHIESFPSMESHYSRKSTKRQYLDRNLNIAKMYSLYLALYKEKKWIPVSEITYRRIFCREYNLSFFKPKKDQCSICSVYQTAKGGDKEQHKQKYIDHIERKKARQNAKAKDKERANNENNFLSLTLDLQAVLQIPCGDVSQLY
ncbi:uncharacterized protein [Diabrotica undecimpunctata]|uniref:uncharacterized protein n=1 Tax=Diabrotica undecimpunctata TaxID=50387 RepID=UPI003B6387FC